MSGWEAKKRPLSTINMMMFPKLEKQISFFRSLVDDTGQKNSGGRFGLIGLLSLWIILRLEKDSFCFEKVL
jgi:hypothetical protein